MLKDCKNVCDHLIVLLQTDPSVDRTWKNKPVQTVDERLIMLKGVKYVDEVILYTKEQELEDWLIANKDKLHVRIIGFDHVGSGNITGHEAGISIHYHNRDHSWSSSDMRRRICAAEINKQ